MTFPDFHQIVESAERNSRAMIEVILFVLFLATVALTGVNMMFDGIIEIEEKKESQS